MAGCKFKGDIPYDGRKRHGSFLQREGCADADSMPSSERQIGVAADFLAGAVQELSGIKYIRPVP